MLVDVTKEKSLWLGTSPGSLWLDGELLAQRSVGNVVIFPDRRPEDNRPIDTYVISGVVSLPAGTSTVWRGPSPHSVRLRSEAPVGEAAIGLGGPCRRVEFRNLVFDGMGVSLEHECDQGVLLRDCDFVGVKRDFALRGSLDGIRGADGVIVQRCTFSECGVDRGFVYWELIDSHPLNVVAKTRGVGAVWIPRQATRWRLEKCIMTGGRGLQLGVDGSEVDIVDCDIEALESDPDDLLPFVEIRSRSSVHLSRMRFGNEPNAPTTSIRLSPYLSENLTEDVTLRAVQGAGRTSASAFFPALGSMAVL